MARNADDILIGGGKVYIGDSSGSSFEELGWLSGEIKLEEQGSPLVVKESEGGTVLTLNLDKEVHFTFNLLDVNLDTLQKLNPSMGGIVLTDQTYPVKFEHTKRSGAKRVINIFKGKVSGNFTALLLNQDNASPIPVDIIAIADDSKTDKAHNIYTITETPAEGGNG